MGNFEKLSVLVIVVIIVMILVVALHTWGANPGESDGTDGKPLIRNVNPVFGNEGLGEGLGGGADDGGVFSNPAEDGPQSLVRIPGPNIDDDPFQVPIVTPEGPTDTRDPVADAPTTPLEYTIKSGDTLGQISKDVLGSTRHVPKIMDLNPGVDPSALRVGTKLRLPQIEGAIAGRDTSSTRGGTTPGGGGTTLEVSTPRGGAKPGGSYTTRAGDTFERISKRVYGTIERWPDIWVANLAKVPDSDRLTAGTTLSLPK